MLPAPIPAANNSLALMMYCVLTPPQPPDKNDLPTVIELVPPAPTGKAPVT